MKTLVVMTVTHENHDGYGWDTRPDLTKYFTNMLTAKKFAYKEIAEWNEFNEEITTNPTEDNGVEVAIPNRVHFKLNRVKLTA